MFTLEVAVFLDQLRSWSERAEFLYFIKNEGKNLHKLHRNLLHAFSFFFFPPPL